MGRTLKKTFIWKELGQQLRLSGTPDTLFYQLRVIYYKYLLSFEHKYQISKDRDNQSNAPKIKTTWIKPNEEDYNHYKYEFQYLPSKQNDNDNDETYQPLMDQPIVSSSK